MAGKALDAEAVRLYLHARTELLAVASKLGQLYVQRFPDPAAVAAVDQYEALASGLSNKVWQKLAEGVAQPGQAQGKHSTAKTQGFG